MLEIHVGAKGGRASGPVVPIRWCLDREAVKGYSAAQLRRLQMLVLVLPGEAVAGSARERRKLVPVTDLMTYVEFDAPGPNLVYFCVLDPEAHGGLRGLTKFLLARTASQGRFQEAVLYGSWHSARLDANAAGTGIAEAWAKRDLVTAEDGQSAGVLVEVPPGVFAKPPPAWEQRWVNHFFLDGAFDQCSYRRRRLFAYTLQAPLLLARSAFALAAFLFLAACGFVGISPSPAWRPLSSGIEEVWADRRYWSHALFGPDTTLWQFNPALVLCLGGLIHLVRFEAPYWSNVLVALGFVTALTLAVLALAGLFILGTMLPSLARTAWASRLAARLRRVPPSAGGARRGESDEDRAYAARAQAVLACAPGQAGATLASVPRDFRTVRLVFEDVKAKICRPFAR